MNNLPKNGQIIIFQQTPIGSYTRPGETYRVHGRLEFRFAYGPVTSWAPTLKDARQAALDLGCFKYVDDEPLVYVSL